ncbi:MAG: TerB family tellurite resistance protein, partial [Glaciecola sp.]
MQLSPNQRFNEALIKTAVLLYQVDGLVSLTEQDYLEEVIDDLNWQSPICKDAFLTQAIHEARVANDAGDALAFLKYQADELNFDAAKVVEVAMGITGVDGERSEHETELLHYLTHKL